MFYLHVTPVDGPSVQRSGVFVLGAVQGIICDAEVESSSQVPGSGMLGCVEGRRLVVGTPELLTAQRVADPEGRMALAVQQWSQAGKKPVVSLFTYWCVCTEELTCSCMDTQKKPLHPCGLVTGSHASTPCVALQS